MPIVAVSFAAYLSLYSLPRELPTYSAAAVNLCSLVSLYHKLPTTPGLGCRPQSAPSSAPAPATAAPVASPAAPACCSPLPPSHSSSSQTSAAHQHLHTPPLPLSISLTLSLSPYTRVLSSPSLPLLFHLVVPRSFILFSFPVSLFVLSSPFASRVLCSLIIIIIINISLLPPSLSSSSIIARVLFSPLSLLDTADVYRPQQVS